jgi:DNA-binding HxlR family transcriptional regulator
VPPTPWTGYGRFCPLARALDVVGERWTLVIVQELLKRPSRYGELLDRLPGISTTLLAERLRRLENAGVVHRRAAPVGHGVLYDLTDRGRELEAALRALREWGARFLFDPTADGQPERTFDVSYVAGAERIPDGVFELIVDSRATTLSFADGRLHQKPRVADDPELVITTDSEFLQRWAAGDSDWEHGVRDGAVVLDGPAEAWEHWLAASGYRLRYPSDDGSGA